MLRHTLLLLYCTTQCTVCDGFSKLSYVVSTENCRAASQAKYLVIYQNEVDKGKLTALAS